VAHVLGLILGNHVRTRQLGLVYAAETGFLLTRDPDTVRAPDVAFVARERAVGIDDDLGICNGRARTCRRGRVAAGDVVPGLTISVAELFQG
jgi:hypothetical protein